MEFLTYGVSVGDYGAGLLLRAYRNGFSSAIWEDVDTDAVFIAGMSETDDRVYDATSEQWQAARAEFSRGFLACKAIPADDYDSEA